VRILRAHPRITNLTADRVFLGVFLPLVLLFGITAQWTLPYHIDPLTNAITGWYWAETGSPIATEHAEYATPEQRGNLGWFVPSPRGPVSQYPLGAGLLPAIVYFLANTSRTTAVMSGTENPQAGSVEVPMPPVWPATLSSVLATAAACAVLAVVYRRLGGTARQAVIAGLFSGVATTAWAVASTASWTHGPAILFIALGLLAASHQAWFLTGLAFGVALTIRPHIAVIVACIGIAAAMSERRWKPVLLAGLGSILGLVALISFNYWLWETVTITGGYSTELRENLLTGGWLSFVGNVWGALVDLRHGLLVWAPFLVLVVPAAIIVRKTSPRWALGAAIGGLLYLLIQLRANRFSGGGGHFAYRYPLEALTAAAPLLFLGYLHWIVPRSRMHRIFVALGAMAIAGQAAASFIL
jgi:hypothetical protein